MEVLYSVEVPGLGDRIRQARKDDGRQLSLLAALAEISVQSWHRIEGEKQATPIDTLRRVETALGIDLELPKGLP